MNSPSNQKPLAPGDPLLRAIGKEGVSAEGVAAEDLAPVAYPPAGGAEVIPSGNFPQRAASQQTPMPAPRPVRAGMGGEDTEIISVLRDPGAPRRRRPRNRKALSPLKLLGMFAALQIVIGLLGFAVFGGMIRSWFVAGTNPSDGLTAEEATALRSRVDEASADFGRFDHDLSVMKEQVAVSPGDAREQLKLLGRRNELTMFADDAITNGTRAAFDKLLAASENLDNAQALRDGATAEILRVKDFYASGNRLGSYSLPVATLYPSLITAAEEGLKASQLIELLGDKELPWRVRNRAAYLLANHRGLAVSEALVQAVRSDPNLDVVKECVLAFEENTGYRSKGMFEIEALENWWTVYEARVSVPSASSDPG